jgi:mannose-6-phosphate isomerase-like protein (cupin superfamily)
MPGLSYYEKDIRPWGHYERFTLNQESTVKIITVDQGEAFSLQKHDHRAEFWRVISGSGVLTIGENSFTAKPGEQYFIQTGQVHRAQGGEGGLVFLEISFGTFDEKRHYQARG